MSADIFASEQQTWLGSDPPTATHTGVSRVIGVATLIVTITAALLGYLAGHAPVDGLQRVAARQDAVVAALQQQVHLLALTHHCSTYGGTGHTIQQLITKGQYNAAAQLATLYLANPALPACPGSGLAGLWYAASMDALFSTPPGTPADETPVLTWQGIEAHANALGLGAAARLSPLSVFVTAYNNQEFALARAAFDQAWQQQLVGPTDRSQLVGYYDTLRNEGKWLSRSPNPQQRATGWHILKTAVLLSQRAQLGRGEAWSDLISALGRARATRMAPEGRDPVLHSFRGNS